MTASKHSPEYLAYIRSPLWRKRRKALIQERNHTCGKCGLFRFGAGELQVHHLTYDRLGHEKDTDMLVVCRHCHGLADEERKVKVAADSARRLDDARFEGWARAKYGDEWHLDDDPGMREEFEDFLEGVNE